MNEPTANEDSLVGLDVPCEACGYNLHGSSRDGVCPECARAVPLSLARYYDVAGGFAAGRRDALGCYGYAATASGLGLLFALRLGGFGTRGRGFELLNCTLLCALVVGWVMGIAVAASWRDRYPRWTDWPMIWPIALLFVMVEYQYVDVRRGPFQVVEYVFLVVVPCWIVGEAYFTSVRTECRSARSWSLIAIFGLLLICACLTNEILGQIFLINSNYFGTGTDWPLSGAEVEFIAPFGPALTVPAVLSLARHLRRNGHPPAEHSSRSFLQIIGLQSSGSASETPARRPG